MSSSPASSQKVDVSEHGATRNGSPQTLQTRLFMQLLAFDCDHRPGPNAAAAELRTAFERENVPSVLYEDVQRPEGLALLSWAENPSHFVDVVRPLFNALAHECALRTRPGMCMLGRTYSTGFEPDLTYWLVRRPLDTVTNAHWPWAVWYPLRRGGAFEKLDPSEKMAILREHGAIGRAYGEADLAHDIRLACHGLDVNDNEYLIGLIGHDLHPLSHVVQTMRSTRQTSEFIARMGPFFVGKRRWALAPEAL